MKFIDHYNKYFSLKYENKILPIFKEKTHFEIKNIISICDTQFIDKIPIKFDTKTLNNLLRFRIDSDIKELIVEEVKSRNKTNKKIRESFLAINSREQILNFFDLSNNQLNYLIYDFNDQKYLQFYLKKKKGGEREILSPIIELKILQRNLSKTLNLFYSPKITAHGFIENKSIITNAFRHLNQKYVLNIDLKDFFPSINFGRVYGLFNNPPFEFNKDIATILAQICCYNGKLPQGAPTSPILSNMICLRMDKRLLKLAKENYITYTRYADDLTFSTSRNDFESELKNEIERIIINEGFTVNQSKVRLQTRTMRQEVTGLTVNEKVNINRKYIRNIRAILHSWEKDGYETASIIYYAKYSKTRRSIPTMKLSLRGKIEFIGSIRGKDDVIYKNLFGRWEALSFSKEVSQFDIKKKSEQKLIKEINLRALSKFKDKTVLYDCNLNHTPKDVVKMLQNFTNPTMKLRNLVHTSDQPGNVDIEKIIREGMQEYIAIKRNFKYELRRTIINELFNFYRSRGIEINKITRGKHPMENNLFREKINKFSTKIRLGSEKYKETNLEKMIFGILQDDSFKHIYKKINFKNNKLPLVSVFIDVDSFKSGLLSVLKVIKEYFENDHSLIIKASKISANDPLIKKLEIIHIGSVADTDIETFKSRINSGHGSLSKIKNQYFRGICDWNIESKFIDGNSYRVKVLNSNFPSGESDYIEIDDFNTEIFLHTLIFY